MKRLVQFLVSGTVLSVALLSVVSASGSGSKSAVTIPAFSVDELSAPAGANWIHQAGNVQAWRYSTLSQINTSNGSSLKLAWTTHLANPTTPSRIAAGNANPIIYKGAMFVQDAWTRITSLDAASGKILWQFDPQVGLNVPGNGTNMRSVGMGDGMVFTGAYGVMYAINAQTGAQVWANQVVDPVGGGGIDVSPVYYKGLVLIGTTGGDWGGSCQVIALDAKTGKVKWHYSSIPSNPKAFGWNTWPANRFYYGGGAIWDTVSVNPKYDLVYWGTGNPLPFNGLINGPGAQFGTESVYAVNALTGKFAWMFQEVHHDIWDMDAMQTPLTYTITKDGKKVDVVDHINKTGLNYVLDAKTGKPVIPVRERPVPQSARAHTYPTQPFSDGDDLVPQVVIDPENWKGILAPDGKPYVIPTEAYTPYTDEAYVVFSPTFGGGVEWPEPSFSPQTGFEYVCTNIQSVAFSSPPAADQHPVISSAGNIIQLKAAFNPKSKSISRLVAFNPATNKIVWKVDDVSTGGLANGNSTGCASPVTTTAGGIALIGRVVGTPAGGGVSQPAGGPAPTPSAALVGGAYIQAYDVKTGVKNWQIPVLINGKVVAVEPRISTYSVNGKQYLVSFTHAGAAGADISAYALP